MKKMFLGLVLILGSTFAMANQANIGCNDVYASTFTAKTDSEGQILNITMGATGYVKSSRLADALGLAHSEEFDIVSFTILNRGNRNFVNTDGRFGVFSSGSDVLLTAKNTTTGKTTSVIVDELTINTGAIGVSPDLLFNVDLDVRVNGKLTQTRMVFKSNYEPALSLCGIKL